MEHFKNIGNVFVTGDIHGDIDDLTHRVDRLGDVCKQDIMFLLGDCAFFYMSYYELDHKEDKLRRVLANQLPITFICIQGNHEEPYQQMKAEKIKFLGGEGYTRDGIFFAANGTVLTIKGKRFLILGGAGSVDKKIRVARNYPYWPNEEMSEQELEDIISKYSGQHFDFVLSHTAPYSLMPRDTFMPGIDQSTIENKTEKAFERLLASITYGKWLCGHFHLNRQLKEITFLDNYVVKLL